MLLRGKQIGACSTGETYPAKTEPGMQTRDSSKGGRS
jgi:hypothetical protein